MCRNCKKCSLQFGFESGAFTFHCDNQTGEEKAASVLGDIFLASPAWVGRFCQLVHRTHLRMWLGHGDTARWRVHNEQQTDRNQCGNQSAEELATLGEILMDRELKLKMTRPQHRGGELRT